MRLFLEGTLAVVQRDRATGLAIADEILENWRLRDPCATYYLARTLAALDHPRAIETFRRAVEGGFHSYAFFIRDPWLDRLRTDAAFTQVLALAEEQYRGSAEAFVAAGGERVLGPVRRE
jgi:hypothetical protein